MSHTYFVTGGTGFLGRFVVSRLLARGATVYALARPGSEHRLDVDPGDDDGGRDGVCADDAAGTQVQAGTLSEKRPGRLLPIAGDITLPKLGVHPEQREALKGRIDFFLHVAALYDLRGSEADLHAANVDGTRHALELCEELGAGAFHHVSSVAVAGSHEGVFDEEMFDEGQTFPHAYHRTKFEAEGLVRRTKTPWRIYRPSIIVGHSETGEIDKADGPYHFFKAIQKTRSLLPQWFPLVGLELGATNLVPVDFVAGAIDFLVHREGLDGRVFHLVDHRRQPVGEVINAFARAAHAPQLAVRLQPGAAGGLVRGLLTRAAKLPAVGDFGRELLSELSLAPEVLPHVALKTRFDARRTRRELLGAPMPEPPPLDDYAWRLWDYWERELDASAQRGSSETAMAGQHVLITGASSGIGRATALQIAAAGGIALLVARSEDKLREACAEIEAAGGHAYFYTCDLSDFEAIDELVDKVLAEHSHVDVLVNNAGRSIRRSVALSYDRLHDYERTIRLNYLGAVRLTMGLLPGMRARRRGHVVNVSSIGVQFNPPRFSAYVASKAALDAWTRVASSETLGDGVSFSTIHMPLVRTPMIAPTRIYDAFPAISPEEAAELICRAIRTKPKRINTRLGTFGEVAYTLAPKAMDRLLHAAYRVFPDSPAARGDGGPELDERVSAEARALAHVVRGVHW